MSLPTYFATPGVASGPESSFLHGISTSTSSWSAVPVDILCRVVNLFKRERSWCYIGPLLRRVCKDWRDAIDGIGLHMTLEKLPLHQLRRVIPPRAQDIAITSLLVTPHFGSVFALRRLGEEAALVSLRDVRLSRIDDGDEVLAGLVPLGKQLQRMELLDVKLTHHGFDAISQWSALIELHLREVTVLGRDPLDFQLLGFLDKLRRLSIVWCPGFIDMSLLSRLTTLESLEYESNELEVVNLDALSHLTALQSLSLMTPIATKHGLEFLTALHDLRAFKVNAHVITNHVFTIMKNLKTLVCSLRILQVTGGCSLEGYSRVFPAPDGPTAIRLFSDRQPFLCTYERRNMATFITAVMTKLDLAGICMSRCELWMLTHISSLKKLCLHEVQLLESLVTRNRGMRNTYNDIAERELQFPSLECLTLRQCPSCVSLLSRMVLPVLKHLGIWFDKLDPLCRCFWLRDITTLCEVSLGTHGRFSDDALWTTFARVLCQCAYLKRIGWRNASNELTVGAGHPFVQYCELQGVIVDTDISVFFS